MLDQAPMMGGANGGQSSSAAQGTGLSRLAGSIARWSMYLAVLLVPLFYLPFTSEGLEFNKQALLIVLTVTSTLAWLGKMLVERKAELRRSVVNLFVGIYLVVYALSTWMSTNRYMSIVGDNGQEKSGLVTVVCFALMFFVATNLLRGAKDVKKVLSFLILGGFLAIVHAYLQAFGLRALPGTAAQSNAFNLIGASNGLGVYAAVMLVLIMGKLLAPQDGKMLMVRRVLAGITGALALFYIATLAFWGLWAVLIAASATLVAYGMIKTDKVKNVTMLALPMAVVVIAVVFLFVRFPISLGTPIEVMPSIRASWDIAREALANSPLWGSGPGTFQYDYAQFRSKDLNATAFWSVGFDRSASRLLTLLATTGILGFATLMVWVIYLGGKTALSLSKNAEEWSLSLTVFAGWVGLLVAKALYSSNFTLDFLFWVLTALLVVLQWGRWQEYRFENSPRAALMLSFLFIVAIIFSVAGVYLEGQRYAAERRFTIGSTRAINNLEDVDAAVDDLVRATQLNGQNDLYYRTLSQALTLRTNLEVQRAGEKPTEEQSRTIAVLAANAVNAGKRATDLNPSSVQNWASLSSLYRDLVGATPGAEEAAVAAYERAIALEPNNPVHRTDLGRVYLASAESRIPALSSKDEAQKTAAKKEFDERLVKAKEQFDKAIELKADYATAHYWLAVVLERMGKADEALAKLESVRNFNPEDLGVGFQLAILYYQNGKKDMAIAELERIITLSPQYSNARWYLSAMYEEAGKLDEAIAQIEEVVKYNKDLEVAKKRLEELKAKKAGAAAPPAEGLPEPVGP
jgi:tetratricopeptide (TPR) repeat protein